MNNLKWAAIQPLTGAAYIGTEEVIGHPAEYILSFPGLEKEYYDKNGKLANVGNERNLLEYLRKHNRLPNYFTFEKGMFDYDITDLNVNYIDNDYFFNYGADKVIGSTDLDLVIAVPVCSGLSGANCADHGKMDSTKNNNMRFIASFVLNKIKPKSYIFENAPGLFTNKGYKVRCDLERIADKAGYSITYIKTNTILHQNIQNRPRTFVIFWKSKWPCIIGFENSTKKSVSDFLAEIPSTATQNTKEFIVNDVGINFEYQFLVKKFGKTWRDHVSNYRLKSFIIANKLTDEFYQFHKDEKLKAHYDYCQHKLDIHKGYYDRSFFLCTEKYIPTVYHGNTWSMLHPKEDRTFTFRELMHTMGIPHDFDYLHNTHTFGSVIGQNVPAKTIGFWIKEICNNLIDWQEAIKNHPVVQTDLLAKQCDFVQSRVYHDNTKRKTYYA